jgi:hypothetical protein
MWVLHGDLEDRLTGGGCLMIAFCSFLGGRSKTLLQNQRLLYYWGVWIFKSSKIKPSYRLSPLL